LSVAVQLSGWFGQTSTKAKGVTDDSGIISI